MDHVTSRPVVKGEVCSRERGGGSGRDDVAVKGKWDGEGPSPHLTIRGLEDVVSSACVARGCAPVEKNLCTLFVIEPIW